MNDIIVIGAGLSGLTAAETAAAAGARVALVEPSPLYGGLVGNVEQVEGIPERPTASGLDIASELLESALRHGASLTEAAVRELETTGTGFRLRLDDGGTVEARAAIVASGARLRALAVPGAAGFIGRGVSQCADCDGPLFMDEEVAVVGGGDAAASEALVLAGFCRRVTLLCRSRPRARPEFLDRLAAAGNVDIREGVEVVAIAGDRTVETVRLRIGGTESDMAVTGVFPFIGVEPNGGFLPPSVRDGGAFALADGQGRTSHSGLFAVGAVRRGYSGRLADAVGEARAAASAALAHIGR